MEETRVLIADTSTTFNLNVKRYLEERGFQCVITEDGSEALKLIQIVKPQLVFLDLLLPKMNAIAIMNQLSTNDAPLFKETKIIVASSQGNVDNIKRCLTAGAVDYLLKPIELEDFVARLTFHLQQQKQVQDKAKDPSNLYLYLIELILKQVQVSQSPAELLFKVSQMTAMALKSVRVSITQCAAETHAGRVRASSDDNSKNNWPLDLNKYPEIMFVLTTGKTVAVENIDADPVLSKIKGSFNNIRFNSLIVAPIFYKEKLWGVLSIRLPAGRTKILNVEIRFAQLVAHVVGLGLRLLPETDQLKMD